MHRKRRSRIPGSTPLNEGHQPEHNLAVGLLPVFAREAQPVGPGGGPPVLGTSTSTGPERRLDGGDEVTGCVGV